jgi:hypothetical protein
MLKSTFVLNKAFRSSTLTSKLLAIVAKLFDWDCNISYLVIGCSKVGIGGGVAGLDDSLGVSSDIGLKLCAEFGED